MMLLGKRKYTLSSLTPYQIDSLDSWKVCSPLSQGKSTYVPVLENRKVKHCYNSSMEERIIKT